MIIALKYMIQTAVNCFREPINGKWRAFASILRAKRLELSRQTMSMDSDYSQRDTGFVNYQDLRNQRYVEAQCVDCPQRTLGKGRVELIEIPSTWETIDNIAAFGS